MVTSSLQAFDQFMLELANYDEWEIHIFNKTAQFP